MKDRTDTVLVLSFDTTIGGLGSLHLLSFDALVHGLDTVHASSFDDLLMVWILLIVDLDTVHIPYHSLITLITSRGCPLHAENWTSYIKIKH